MRPAGKRGGSDQAGKQAGGTEAGSEGACAWERRPFVSKDLEEPRGG